MATSVSTLATHLDLHMIGPSEVQGCHVPDHLLPVLEGAALAVQLKGRKLLHFVTLDNLGSFRDGTSRPIFTTPTPYNPGDVIGALALPGAGLPREHVIVLEPTKLEQVAGPRYVAWGQGIEYILLNGFKRDAIASKWELKLW
ncbi:hypothetical protein [Streptomyces adonidis]|uniref:hypothetical protein n=1 Tax=Streptomyces adonidis TaxID=3231367 RepID=UPI0034DAE73C